MKQPLQDAIVPSAGSKVQGSRSISVLAGQADISTRHLFGVNEKKDLSGGLKNTNVHRKELLYFSTHQPHHHSLVAHVSSSVQAGHAIVGPQVDVSPAVFHEVLHDTQVPFLAGQIERGSADACLVVHTPVLQHTATTGEHEVGYQPLNESKYWDQYQN